MKPIPPAFQWAIVALLLIALLGGILYALRNHAPGEWTGRDEFQVRFDRLGIPPRPAHIPETFLAEVQGLGGFPAVLDSRQADLLPKLAEAFARHPWVDRVGRVVRESGQQITIEIEFRHPVAVVQVGQSRYPIDRHATLLPELGGSSSGRLLVVEGWSRHPAVVPGKRWGAPAVEAAAALAASLGREKDSLELAAIEIWPGSLDTELALRTRKGTRVIWSAGRGSTSDPEASIATKLQRLRDYRQRYGGLDRPAGPYLLDVRAASGGMLRKSLPKD